MILRFINPENRAVCLDRKSVIACQSLTVLISRVLIEHLFLFVKVYKTFNVFSGTRLSIAGLHFLSGGDFGINTDVFDL